MDCGPGFGFCFIVGAFFAIFIGSFINAVFMMLATRIITRIQISYMTAYITTVVSSMIAAIMIYAIIRIAASQGYSPGFALILMLPAVYLVNSTVIARMIKDPDTWKPIGMVEGMLTTLVMYAINLTFSMMYIFARLLL